MTHPSPSPKPRWKNWKVVGIGAAILGALTLGACHSGGHGWHHRNSAMHGEMSPEEAGKRVDKMVNWVLDDVDATTEQKQKVSGIAKSAINDLMPLRQQHRAARDKAIDLLTQASVDRATLEQLRSAELQLAETASRRVTQAIADIAEVITPEQRRKLADQMRKRWG